MKKVIMKKAILCIVGVVYSVLLFVFWWGLVVSLIHLPQDPVLTDLHYACFGIGLCALPALLFTVGSFGFYYDLSKELFSLKAEEKTGH